MCINYLLHSKTLYLTRKNASVSKFITENKVTVHKHKYKFQFGSSEAEGALGNLQISRSTSRQQHALARSLYIFLYRNIILSDKSHYSSFRTFPMTAGSEAIAAFLVCPKSVFVRFLVQSFAVSFMFHPPSSSSRR